MRTNLKLATLALCFVASAMVDGSIAVPNTETAKTQTAIQADCFEDEAVIVIVSNFEGGAPFDERFDAGEFACAPYDDIDAGNRPSDWREGS